MGQTETEAVQSSQTTVLRHPKLAAASALLWHDLLLGERLYLFSWVRFLVAGGIVVGSLAATYLVGIEGLDIPRLAGCAVVLLIYNTVVFLVVRGYRRVEQAAPAHTLLVRISHATITLDFLVLTYAIWLVGGAESPFLPIYLLHIILAAVLLTRRAAYGHAVFGYLLLAGLVLGEWLGWLPRNRPLGVVPRSDLFDSRYVLTILVVYGLLMAGASYLMTGLAQALRGGERELRRAIAELDNVSSMRRSFLHIALHDLKAPVSGMAMLLENLSSGLGGPLTTQQAHWVERASSRAHELLSFLRDLQVLGEVERIEMEAQAKPMDSVALLRNLVKEHEDLAQQRRHTLRLEIPDSLPHARGVERLLHEAVANYVTNAIKYTPEGGTIILRAFCRDDVFRVEVQDNGRGIAAEDQKRLFNEFARIIPEDQTGPPPGGTGLGLWIVRRIAEAHGARFGVVSQLKQGSTFFLEVPLATPK